MRLRVEVIIPQGTSATRAAMHATTTIPIVMSYTPFAVEQGFVASRARPGGNVTGISVVDPALVGKQLEMLKAAVPDLTHLGGLFGTENPGAAREEHALLAATRPLGITLHPIHDPLRTASRSTLEQLFAKIIQEPLDALWVPGALTVFHQEIAAFAVQKGLPTIGWNGLVERGGLMTYETFGSARVVATYVDRILNGAQPAELPIERPLCCKLVINLKTAKALGLTIPPTLLFQADEVIQ
jgi:putative ABC transport system substrate-binding protein